MLMLRQILSEITVARGQDALLRGQDGLLRCQDGLFRSQDGLLRGQVTLLRSQHALLRGQDNLAQMVQKVRSSNHRTQIIITQRSMHRFSRCQQFQMPHMNFRRSTPAILTPERKFWPKLWTGSVTFLALLRPSFGCLETRV
jgi:hypothetical protein